MKKLKIPAAQSVGALVLVSILSGGAPMMASADAGSVKICGWGAVGVGAVIGLCTGVDSNDRKLNPNSARCVGCTSFANVGQSTSSITVSKGTQIFICSSSGWPGEYDWQGPGNTFTANIDGMYGINGNRISGFSYTWYDPKQYPTWVCK